MLLNNIYPIIKPLNWTSNDVVQYLKKQLKLKKIGHGGTLDPLATGVLIIGINQGTKLLQYHLSETKQYLITITFGFETDTLDLEGKIVKEKELSINIKHLIIALDFFKNHIYEQIPPKYSAIKVNGKNAYQYARSNQEIVLFPREVKLINYQIISYKDNQLELLIDVSKGFYVRAFARDLGYKLNTYATITALKRTKSGNFKIENAYQLEDFINEYQRLQEN